MLFHIDEQPKVKVISSHETQGNLLQICQKFNITFVYLSFREISVISSFYFTFVLCGRDIVSELCIY